MSPLLKAEFEEWGTKTTVGVLAGMMSDIISIGSVLGRISLLPPPNSETESAVETPGRLNFKTTKLQENSLPCSST